MREHHDSIVKHGVTIIPVVPTNSAQIKQFLHVYGPYPFDILGDPQQVAYKTLGLRHVSVGKSLKVMTEYLLTGRIREIFPKDKEQMKIIKKAMTSQDVYQLGGTWLIEKTGEILWQHVDADPTDYVKIPQLLKILEEFKPLW